MGEEIRVTPIKVSEVQVYLPGADGYFTLNVEQATELFNLLDDAITELTK